LEKLVGGWTKENDERTNRWIDALKVQKIVDIEGLEGMASNHKRWHQFLGDVCKTEKMLAVELKIWSGM
jgi:hypothetical protein